VLERDAEGDWTIDRPFGQWRQSPDGSTQKTSVR
jgi:hypothetical protein